MFGAPQNGLYGAKAPPPPVQSKTTSSAQLNISATGAACPYFADVVKQAIESGSMKHVTEEITRRFAAPLSDSAAAGPPDVGASPTVPCRRYAQLATEFLSLLLICRSADYAVGETSVAESEASQQFHAAVSAIAAPASLSLVKHIRNQISLSVKKGSGEMARVFTTTSSHASSDSSHLLLAAQCLYLLSRHFLMEERWVGEMLDAVRDLLRIIQKDDVWYRMSVAAFAQSRGSASFSALLWILVLSVSNATAPWKRKRASNGSLVPNALARSDAASRHLETFITEFPRELAENRSKETFQLSPAVDSFVSMLTLIWGCLLRGNNNEVGYDKALESFLGGREGFTASPSKGKSIKRMIQLAPASTLLAIPVEQIYIGPYEILSYVFDEMLPLLRHVSELELSALKKHLDQLQLYEEIPGVEMAGGAMDHKGLLDRHSSFMHQFSGRVDVSSDPLASSLRPFTSEIPHVLEALKVCLHELPSRYLDPDLDSDCAATWFIFRNCVQHLSQALKIVKGTSSSFKWENYSFKLVSRFIDVLTMIGRHPQYIERIAELLAGAQAICTEIEWGCLVKQALACVGFFPDAESGDGGTTLFPTGFPQADQLYRGFRFAPEESRQREGGTNYPLLLRTHRQFTEEYSRKTQQMYISSFFMLLRQLLAHPSLRHVVKGHITLPMALSFLFAPLQTPSTLGSALSLVSSLISSQSEAATTWEFLSAHQLLGASDTRNLSFASAGESDTAGTNKQHLTILGHCRFEAAQGAYAITVGFLNLAIALFRYDVPELTRAPLYNAITQFIAQEVFCGASRRTFADQRERHTVIALAATFLRQALLVRFASEMASSNSTIPFATVMATSVAPSDVVGEIEVAIDAVVSTEAEVLSHQRVALRQCLHLLHTAVHCVAEQKIKIFSFDARTTQDSSLAYKLLTLTGSSDLALAKAALEFLLLFPHDIMSEATRHWHVEHRHLLLVTNAFTAILHPRSVVHPPAAVEPELAILDGAYNQSLHNPEMLLYGVKGLMLDLLTQHASATEHSLTAWLCGFPYPSQGGVQLRRGSNTRASTNSSLLSSVVLGATSTQVEEKNPNIAVKYVKLIYELRSSRLHGCEVMRKFTESHCQSLFLSLLHVQPTACNPVLLSKYAHIIRVLSLELCDVYKTAPNQLSMDLNAMHSIQVEVALSLLHPRRGPSGASDLHAPYASLLLEGLSRENSPDVTQWLVDALRHMPAFPTCPQLLHGNERYLVQASDNVIQFDILAIWDVLQQEQMAAQLPPLSTAAVKERLSPYVEANKCFLIYASCENFIDSVCQLISLASSTVGGIRPERLREFVLALISALGRTPTLTVSAQEKISYRLCAALTSVLSKIKILSSEPQNLVSAEEPHSMSFVGTVSGARSVFSTKAGTISDTLHRIRNGSGIAVGSQSAHSRESGWVSPNHSLLRPIVETLVRWGPKIPCIRLDLYNAIMLLSVMPGVSLDDVIIFRSQELLLQLLVDEVCQPFSAVARYNALTLLIQLIQSSSTVCGTFCCAVESSDDGLGPMAIKCCNALFTAVDAATHEATISSSCDINSVQQLIRSTFNLLSAISVRHTPQILQGNVLLRCMSMNIWLRSSQIVLAHGVGDVSGTNSQVVLHRGQDAVRTLFLMTLRWMNVMSAMDGESKTLVEQMRQFFSHRRPLIDFFLQPSHVFQRLSNLSADSAHILEIILELSALLRAMGSSHLVEDCRCLVSELAIPQLLLALVKGPCHFLFQHPAKQENCEASGARGGGGDLNARAMPDVANKLQSDTLALILHNLSDFVMRCEYGHRGNVECGIQNPSETVVNATNALSLGTNQLIRHRSNDVTALIQVVEELSRHLLVYCNNGYDPSVAFPHRRLECIVFSLHALTVLLQSFVLPVCSQNCEMCSTNFQVYLQNTPLAQLHDVLSAAQNAAYAVKHLNTDYSNGIGGVATDEGWRIVPPPVSLSEALIKKNKQKNNRHGTPEGSLTEDSGRASTPSPTGADLTNHRPNTGTDTTSEGWQTGRAGDRIRMPRTSNKTLRDHMPGANLEAALLHDECASADRMGSQRLEDSAGFVDVLSVDHSIRLLKIALANAIRSVRIASEFGSNPMR